MDEPAECVMQYLIDTFYYCAARSTVITRALTDNGSVYKSKGNAEAYKTANVYYLSTKPYTPWSNVEAESVIQTLLREWVYART